MCSSPKDAILQIYLTHLDVTCGRVLNNSLFLANFTQMVHICRLLLKDFSFVTASRSGSNGGGTNNLPPLLFHNVHGENIRISRDGTIARRVESFCKGIAFSSRPVKVNEKVIKTEILQTAFSFFFFNYRFVSNFWKFRIIGVALFVSGSLLMTPVVCGMGFQNTRVRI